MIFVIYFSTEYTIYYRNGSIIADYSIIYATEDFLDNSDEIANSVAAAQTDEIAQINITALDGGPVSPNVTLLAQQALAVNNCMYTTYLLTDCRNT